MTLCIWCMFYLGFYTRCLQYIGFTHRALQLRHNEHDGFSNHQPRDCLLKVCSGVDQRKNQSSASLALVRGIHRWQVNSPHKWPVTRKMFPFDDVIMRPSDAYTCQWTAPSLVRTMACRLLAPTYTGLLLTESWEQISVKVWSKHNNFQARNFLWKCRLQMAFILQWQRGFVRW